MATASQPTVEDVDRTLQSAHSKGIDILSVPPWIVLAHRTKGAAGKFSSFCVRCRTWMLWEESSAHADTCNGQFWDEHLVAKVSEWRQWFEPKSSQKPVHSSWQEPVQSTSKPPMAMKPPTPAEVRSAFASAGSTQLECIHKLPKGVVLGRSERHGKRKREYFAFCMQCSAWLPCSTGDAENHICQGQGWDMQLAAVADEWEPHLRQMRDAQAAGADPFAGTVDHRDVAMDTVHLQPARSYLLRWNDESLLPVPLEVFVSTPADPTVMDIVLYFHGSMEKYTKAPTDVSKHALISLQCPEQIRWPDTVVRNYFWFHEGKRYDYERFHYDKLTVSQELLRAVSAAVDAACALLHALFQTCQTTQQLAVSPRLLVIGCSMGAYAALEYSRFKPHRIAAVACVGGYYDTRCAEALLQTIARIPLLIVHYISDVLCPFPPINYLLEMRLQVSPELTDAWILPGNGHCGDEALRQKAIDWLQSRRPR